MLVHTPIFDLNLPANAMYTCAFMVELAQFEFFDFEPLFNYLWDWDDDEVDLEQWDRAGYGSKFTIPNMSSLFVYSVILGFSMMVFGSFYYGSKKVEIKDEHKTKVQKVVLFFYAFCIRFAIEGYLESVISALINL